MLLESHPWDIKKNPQSCVKHKALLQIILVTDKMFD